MRLALDEVANIGEGAKSRRAKFGARAKTRLPASPKLLFSPQFSGFPNLVSILFPGDGRFGELKYLAQEYNITDRARAWPELEFVGH